MKRLCLLRILRPLAIAIITFIAAETGFAGYDMVGYDFHINRARAFAKADNLDKVIEECDEAVRINPDGIDAYWGRAAAYYRKGLWNEAISNFNEVVRLDPEKAEAYWNLGRVYKQLTNYDKAIESLNRCHDLQPGVAIILRLRGQIYAEKNDFDKAIADYSEAISLQPTNAQAYFYRGQAYRYKGNFDKAADDVATSIHLDPDNPTAVKYLNSLAWQFATSPDSSIRNGKKSVELAKKACDFTNWDNWQFLDTLAAAYAETGDFDNALKYQKAAIAKEGLTETGKRAGLQVRLDLFEQKLPYRENAASKENHKGPTQ
jgi:tetratricopeptide (TPR) repeat protein